MKFNIFVSEIRTDSSEDFGKIGFITDFGGTGEIKLPLKQIKKINLEDKIKVTFG